jgi:hypothetical protein
MGMASIGMNFATYFAVCLAASLGWAMMIGIAHSVVKRLFATSSTRLIVGSAFLVFSVIGGAAFAHFSHRFPRWEKPQHAVEASVISPSSCANHPTTSERARS